MDLLKPNLNKLALKLKHGDQKSGEEIFNYFSPKIFGFFMMRISHKETAEDLTQAVFLKLVDKIYLFNENLGNFHSWFWRIAKNTLTDYFRTKKSISIDNDSLDMHENLSLNANNIYEDFDRKKQIQKILDFTKELNEFEQEIFSLFYISDLSYKDLAKTLGKQEGSIRVIVYRLNQKIKKIAQQNEKLS